MKPIASESHLHTRVGKRLYAIFLLGVLLPMGLALVTSLQQVEHELEDQGHVRLRRAAKEAGLAIFDRLELVSSEVASLAGSYERDPTTLPMVAVDTSAFSTRRFRSVAVVAADGAVIPLLGEFSPPLDLDPEEREQMGAGLAVVRTSFEDGARIVLGRAVDANDLSRGVIWAEIDPVYLWRAGDADVGLSSGGELCVFVQGTALHCSLYGDSPLHASLDEALTNTVAGEIEWAGSDGGYIAAYWSLFLEYGYAAPSWVVVLSESTEVTAAPIAEFRRTFLLLVILSVLVIAFLVNAEVRRIIRPLMALKEGTRRLARQDFATPVAVSSGDEYEDVALSFNRMALRLQNAFSESQQLAEELQENADLLLGNERHLTMIVESSTSGIITCGHDGTVRSFNRTAEEMFGYRREEVMSSPITALIPGLTAARLLQLEGLGADECELEGERANGTALPMEVVVRRDVGSQRDDVMLFLHDLTERRAAEKKRRELEEHAQEAQKMETIGALAAGIAHDFNNLLTPILSLVSVAIDDVPDGSETWADLQQVRSAADEAQALVQQILSFGRSDNGEHKPINLSDVASGTLRLVRTSLPPTITIREEIHPTVETCADPGQLHQVTMNLCKNAVDAMTADGGVLTVCVEEAEISSIHPELQSHLRPGPYLKLSVSDTGKGIHADELSRLFDPFFTTKELGKGTGLGLSVVHGIVKAHAGYIDVESAVDRGTTFHVYLPVVGPQAMTVVNEGHAGEGQIEQQRTQSAPRESDAGQQVLAQAAEEERGTVLVVDDEDGVRRTLARLLGRLGFTVIQAVDGRAGVDAFVSHQPDVELVILDMMMPGMGGEEVLGELRALASDVPVLLSSGMGQEGAIQRCQNDPHVGFVSKPYRPHELKAKIDALMSTTTLGKAIA